MKIRNNIFVVTGGGNGMGREIVLQLLAGGAKVVAADINEPSLWETWNLAGRYQSSLTRHVADITDPASVEALKKKTLDTYGRVNGLINCAGIIQPFVSINDISMEAAERVMKINYYGTLNMTKAFLPCLLASDEGHIVNISSMGGFLPVAGQAIYGASKAGVKLLSECLHSELSGTNVSVTTVFPGAVCTDIKTNSGLGQEAYNNDREKAAKILQAPDAARIILRAMEQNRRTVYPGKDSVSMHMLYSIAPGFATKLIHKKIQHKM